MIDTQELPYPVNSFDLFRALRSLPLPVLLHSGSSGENTATARFDILTAAPSTIFRYQQGELLIESGNTTKRLKTERPFAGISEHFAIDPQPGDKQDLPFSGGGLLGYFSYETQHAGFGIASRQVGGAALPDILAGIYDWALVIDHQLGRCILTSQPHCPSDLLTEIRERLQNTPEAAGNNFHLKSAFRSNFSTEGYEHAFRQVMDYIHAGDCYQVNLAQCFEAECEGDAFEAFSRLQGLARAPFAAYLETRDQAVLSFSPERFLQVDKGRVLTQPIKGTRRRHADEQADQAALLELVNSQKDRAENLMIVDLLRNDLGKVCRTGSVRVDSLFQPHSFSNVHHLISTVSGELKRPQDVLPLLEACFPGGSITGTPKKRAMEIINEIETRPRSVYCGSIAWLGHNGDMDSNIAIRTLVRDREHLYCWGGGGIVADSDQHAEYQESLDKISLFIDALDKNSEGTTQ